MRGWRKIFCSSLPFHAYSIWLFTLSDLKTIVIPQTMFGIFNALAFYSEAEEDFREANQIRVLVRLPIVAFWVWINLLPFAIDNQRREASIREDKLNKPWRTMPTGRMTPAQARALMCFLYPVALCVSSCLGGTRQCLALMVLGFCYNDLDLADWSWASRNAINALGYCCFASGALEVTLMTPLQITSTSSEHRSLIEGVGMIAAVISSTVQMQDMADQEGDRLRARKSLPLTIGDGNTRWITALSMAFWSVVCPLHWVVSNASFMIVAGLGSAIICRTLVFRSRAADKITFRLWNAWIAALYALPLVAAKGL